MEVGVNFPPFDLYIEKAHPSRKPPLIISPRWNELIFSFGIDPISEYSQWRRCFGRDLKFNWNIALLTGAVGEFCFVNGVVWPEVLRESGGPGGGHPTNTHTLNRLRPLHLTPLDLETYAWFSTPLPFFFICKNISSERWKTLKIHVFRNKNIFNAHIHCMYCMHTLCMIHTYKHTQQRDQGSILNT